MPEENWIETNIAARLDRLPWSKWHWLVVIGLGITWLLDGLEVTLASALVGMIKNPKSLGFTDTQVGMTATAYLAGAVCGAVVFGYATDLFGRKKLFFVTLILYLAATAATAFSWNFFSFVLFRFLTGAGIGGEYSAVNSAVDELIPARVRGRVDLAINSTYWIGAALGAGASVLLLKPQLFSPNLGWRLAFGIGATLGLCILFIRRYVPESPRWLVTHGQKDEAERIVDEIESQVTQDKNSLPQAEGTVKLRVRHHTPWREIWRAVMLDQPKRSALSFTLMVAQAFFYNSLLFTYGLVLIKFYQIPGERVGIYLLPLALGNFLGPLLIGKLFDTIGRKKMIAATYATSGLLLLITAWLFRQGILTVTTQAIAWSVIFFVASSAASSAYLTVSEVFPLEIRALAIAIFYACGTLIGGVGAPSLFAKLIESGSKTELFSGYLVSALLMVGAGITEMFIGVDAEGKSLESISAPLSSKS